MQPFNNNGQFGMNSFPGMQEVNQNPFFIAFVNGDAGANAYLVGAGKIGLLFDFNMGKFWIKETDNNGIPKPIRTFTFNEETPKPQVVQMNDNAVSREEFATLTQSVTALSQSVNKLLKDLGGEG